jgi:elongator complex protein 3
MARKSEYYFDPSKYEKELMGILTEINQLEDINPKAIEKILKKYPKDKSKIFSKHHLDKGLKHLHHEDMVDFTDEDIKHLREALKMKPTRTISGVTTVTVLTKPFACPGQCIFCPNDIRMPKSYIATEPGAQRALANRFSPYLQTYNRLQALKNIGHPTEKIELLVLGGTWSSYPEKYQIWFIKECFRAMNDFGRGVVNAPVDGIRSFDSAQDDTIKDDTLHNDGFVGERMYIKKYLESDYNDELRERLGDMSYNKLLNTPEFQEEFSRFICSEDSALKPSEAWPELEQYHAENAVGACKCVGLVLETRPDSIREREALRLRKLGATKIQLGIQTLNDEISEMNKRGEGRVETGRAFNLLRAAGFKIHAHMMPNLYGATPDLDREAYHDLFTLSDYKPDEVKIYPTSTIKFTELYELYKAGKYKPYETDVLVGLIADLMEMTPEYCRLTRIIRDIPSTEIEAGNKTTNLREFVEWKLKLENRQNPNIRNREIKNEDVQFEDLTLDIQEYETTLTHEYFLQYITTERKIAGFLRLSLPKQVNEIHASTESVMDNASTFQNPITDELDGCAMIREVHVYGPSIRISQKSEGEAQHIGLGTKLIEIAKEMSKKNGFKKLAVISAIGTREYYRKRGFELDRYYQITDLDKISKF